MSEQLIESDCALARAEYVWCDECGREYAGDRLWHGCSCNVCGARVVNAAMRERLLRDVSAGLIGELIDAAAEPSPILLRLQYVPGSFSDLGAQGHYEAQIANEQEQIEVRGNAGATAGYVLCLALERAFVRGIVGAP